jgi:hypothetical protein
MPEPGKMNKINFTNKANMQYENCLYRKKVVNKKTKKETVICNTRYRMNCRFQVEKECKFDSMGKNSIKE